MAANTLHLENINILKYLVSLHALAKRELEMAGSFTDLYWADLQMENRLSFIHLGLIRMQQNPSIKRDIPLEDVVLYAISRVTGQFVVADVISLIVKGGLWDDCSSLRINMGPIIKNLVKGGWINVDQEGRKGVSGIYSKAEDRNGFAKIYTQAA